MDKKSKNWCGGVLALDLGEKRVGVAISRSGIIAEPYQTISFDKDFYKKLKEICDREQVEKIIIGLPRSLRGVENEQEKKIKAEAKNIAEKLALTVGYVDERFTSKIAQSRFGKEKVDEESATIILETYLEQKKAIPTDGGTHAKNLKNKFLNREKNE